MRFAPRFLRKMENNNDDQLPSFPSLPVPSVFASSNHNGSGRVIGSGEFGGGAWENNSNNGKLFSSPGREVSPSASPPRLFAAAASAAAAAAAAAAATSAQQPQPPAPALAPAPFFAPLNSHVSSPEIYRQFSPAFAAAATTTTAAGGAAAASAQAQLQLPRLPPLFGGVVGGSSSRGGSLGGSLGSGGGAGPPTSPGVAG